jgi:hypothetical protein
MNIQQQIYPYSVYAISDAIWDSIGIEAELCYSLNIKSFRNSDWNINTPTIRRIITQELLDYEYSY